MLKLTLNWHLLYYLYMTLSGVIEDIIYRNSENGYTILKVLSNGTIVTVAGKFPIVGKGEKLEAYGEFKINKRYGENFMAESVKLYKPTDLDSIVKYLSCGLISGVGEITARHIVDMFKEETLEVIDKTPQLLSKVKGISVRKADEIHKTYEEIKTMQNAVMFLQKYDISINNAIKIYGKYKHKTEEVLLNNPYKLIEDIEGIGFKTADKIAMKIGIAFDSELRIREGILYALSEYAEKQGSTVALTSELKVSALSILELDETYLDKVDEMITDLEISGAVKSVMYENQNKNVDDNDFVFNDKEPALAVARYYHMEDYIAKKLLILSSNANTLKLGSDEDVSQYEKIYKITLHEKQKEAILAGTSEGVVVITGGPGTGKTTIIKAIINILKNNKLKFMLMAPTGRAAKRLEDQTGESASTIHRALEANFAGTGRGFVRNENNLLETDVIVVDEVSMLDVYLMNSLLKATSFGTRLILVGDKDQLPSVGAGNVLADIIASEKFKVVELSQIFRQTDDSMIVVNAHKINNCEMPDLSAKSSDFFYSPIGEPQAVAEEVVSLILERMPKYFENLTSADIQVIAPMKAGLAGVDNLNVMLQEKINPPSSEKKQVELYKRIFRVGDKVMQVVNNYDREWAKYPSLGYPIYGEGAFNGDMGVIDNINTETGEVYVTFDDGRTTCYSSVELDEIVLSYAITIHKSQGSEFPAVVIPIMGGSPLLLNKNLLYTAVTRAKKIVVLIGKQSNIYYMIKNKLSAVRNTMLKPLLEKYNNLFGGDLG